MENVKKGLLHLTQECGEVAQIASKCLIFGLDDSFQGRTCRERLESEVNDILACITYLRDNKVIRESSISYSLQDLKYARIKDTKCVT
jgi:hypothetical protein